MEENVTNSVLTIDSKYFDEYLSCQSDIKNNLDVVIDNQNKLIEQQQSIIEQQQKLIDYFVPSDDELKEQEKIQLEKQKELEEQQALEEEKELSLYNDQVDYQNEIITLLEDIKSSSNSNVDVNSVSSSSSFIVLLIIVAMIFFGLLYKVLKTFTFI